LNTEVVSFKHASSSPTVAVHELAGAAHVSVVVPDVEQAVSAVLQVICAAASVEAVPASTTAIKSHSYAERLFV
jgi:hypothetical protein